MALKNIESIKEQLDGLALKVGKKRDEIRELWAEIEALSDSFNDADAEMSEAVSALGAASRALGSSG